MKKFVKVQRHFKRNREYIVKTNGMEIARYTKVRTIAGYGIVGMYNTGITNFYESEEENSVDKVMLCWVGGLSPEEADKIQFE